ncbi:Sec-independent protein translocase protein TatB [Sansalvadorimonas verongulae]|uniref:Sec-independent protein translocase protein TatB n=1 Tax=Sansalvadorimonas verongulae TaxID=2172824 RepID=UPI0012BD2DE4|nr:Sec-independent protein translocase protein TatB [Sansalvadorimonas verongulae]
MFDIGFLELVIIAVIALVVLGPERLPVAIKTTAIWVSRIKRSFQGIRDEIERELRVDDIRREVHNASVMDELKKTREELEKGVSSVKETLSNPLEGLSKSASADSEKSSIDNAGSDKPSS